MKTIARIALVTMMAAGAAQGQEVTPADLLKFRFPVTNGPTTNAPATTGFPVMGSPAVNPGQIEVNELIPLIQFYEVPITTAIENIARQAGINYLLAPDLFVGRQGDPVDEPIINCKWKNITARDALLRICDEHGLTLVENPLTDIARIRRAGQPQQFVDGRLLDLGADQSAPGTNESTSTIPLIQFNHVPLDVGLMNLIKQSGRSIEMASNLMENVEQSIAAKGTVTFRQRDINIDHSGYDRWFEPMPEISLRWENVTCEQGIVALCENYDLEIVTDPETGNLEIVPHRAKRHHRIGH